MMHKLSKAARKEYESKVARDRRLVRRKVFFPDRLRKKSSEDTEKEEIAAVERMRKQGGVAYTKGDVDGHANDTSLAGASLSSRARFAELWCKHASWSVCERCSAMLPRKMSPPI